MSPRSHRAEPDRPPGLTGWLAGLEGCQRVLEVEPVCRPRHVLCLYIPHYSLGVSAMDLADQAHLPLVLASAKSGRSVVLDASPEARDAGIRPGMAMSETTALCPELLVLYPDPAREHQIAQTILSRLELLSPLVEADPEEAGCWYIDLAGLDRHFRTPVQAGRALLEAVPYFLGQRLGIADSKFTARIAAAMTTPGGIKTIESAQTRSFLNDISVGWLPLPAATIHQLQQLGIYTLGNLAALPGPKVAARFGPQGKRIWDLAQGIDSSPVIARPYQELISETLVMPTPAISRDMLLVGLRQLIARMFGRPALQGKHVREIKLTAKLEFGKSWQRNLVLKEPGGRDHLIRALTLRLQDLELPGPIESITLELSGISRPVAHQEMFAQFRVRQEQSLSAAIQQLSHRYGQSPLYRVVEVQPWSRIPERRYALIATTEGLLQTTAASLSRSYDS